MMLGVASPFKFAFWSVDTFFRPVANERQTDWLKIKTFFCPLNLHNGEKYPGPCVLSLGVGL